MRGSRYSLPGYINALVRRSAKTLLVEGVSDRNLVSRLLVDHLANTRIPPFIDVADIVDDPSLAGLGAKAKVLAIKAHALSVAQSQGKLGSFVDREWGGLVDTNFDRVIPPAPIVQGPSDFKSVGHSVENYHFDIDCVLAYLRYRVPDHLSQLIESAITRELPNALAFASAYSIEISRRGLIGRAGGLLNENSILHSGGQFVLSSVAKIEITRRGIPDPDGIIAEVTSLTLSLDRSSNLEWCIHGHLGENAIWASIAVTAKNNGMPAYEAGVIAQATNEERRRFWHNWLANAHESRRSPLDALVSWAIQP